MDYYLGISVEKNMELYHTNRYVNLPVDKMDIFL